MTDQLTQQQREALEIAGMFSTYARDGLRSKGISDEQADQFYQTLRTYILNSTPTPEGWQLVPERPTDGMVRAGLEGYAHGVDNIGGGIPTMSSCATRRAYRAMLDAAPQQEDNSDE